MPKSKDPEERHPRWIIALTIVVCLAGVGAMIVSLIRGQYLAGIGFLALAIVGALVPRIRNFIIELSLREQKGTVAVNARDGAIEERASRAPSEERDDAPR